MGVIVGTGKCRSDCGFFPWCYVVFPFISLSLWDFLKGVPKAMEITNLLIGGFNAILTTINTTYTGNTVWFEEFKVACMWVKQ